MTISPVKQWRNQKHSRELLGKIGRVVSYTKIYVPQEGFEDQAPYYIAVVDLGNQRVMGQLVDVEDDSVKLGIQVQAVIRRIRLVKEDNVIPYGIKYKLVISER